MPVSVVSLGDYVLNGGEVAVLAIVEAVARLLPGVLGNAESLVEESHEDGLLEYPVYTKPPSGAATTCRRCCSLVTTARSPRGGTSSGSPAPPSAGRTCGTRRRYCTSDGLELRAAVAADAEEVAVLQLACWLPEAVASSTFDIPALTETADDVRRSFEEWRTWVVRSGGRLVGSVRARTSGDVAGQWEIGRLMVAPDLQGRGIGRALLAYAEAQAPAGTHRLWLEHGRRGAPRTCAATGGPATACCPALAGSGGRSTWSSRFRDRAPALAESLVASGTRRAPATGGVTRDGLRVTRPAGTHTPVRQRTTRTSPW